MILTRRRLIGSLAALFAMPAIVRASSLMPIKVLKPTPPPIDPRAPARFVVRGLDQFGRRTVGTFLASAPGSMINTAGTPIFKEITSVVVYDSIATMNKAGDLKWTLLPHRQFVTGEAATALVSMLLTSTGQSLAVPLSYNLDGVVCARETWTPARQISVSPLEKYDTGDRARTEDRGVTAADLRAHEWRR